MHGRPLLLLGIALVAVLSAGNAAAQAPDPAPPGLASAPVLREREEPHPGEALGIVVPAPTPKPETEAVWYGWQILLLDTTTASLAVGTDGVAYPVFALGGPIVHLAHRHYGRAGISLGLRLALPAIGAAVGVDLAGHQCDANPDCWGFEVISGGAVGGLIGMVAASILDMAALSWDSRERVPPRSAVEPYATAGRGSFGLGVRGGF